MQKQKLQHLIYFTEHTCYSKPSSGCLFNVILIISVVDAASVKLILRLQHTRRLHAVLLEINTDSGNHEFKTFLREHLAIQEQQQHH